MGWGWWDEGGAGRDAPAGPLLGELHGEAEVRQLDRAPLPDQDLPFDQRFNLVQSVELATLTSSKENIDSDPSTPPQLCRPSTI